MGTADTEAEVISSNRGVEKKLLGVEFLNVMEEHRLCRLESGGHVFHITAFHNERLVREREAVFCKRLLATVVDSLFESLAPGGENVLFHACIKEGLLCLFDGDERLLKLSVEERFTSTNGKLSGLRPMSAVKTHIIGGVGINEFTLVGLCEDFSLSYIGVVCRTEAVTLVVLFGWNVAVLLFNLGEELLC